MGARWVPSRQTEYSTEFLSQAFSSAKRLPAQFILKRSARAKRSRIIIRRAGQIEVISPIETSEKKIVAFVNENYYWILKTLEKLAKLKSFTLWPERFVSGATILYRGQLRPMRLLSSPQPPRVRFDGETFIVECVDDNFQLIKKAFIQWFKEDFALELKRQMAIFGPKFSRKALAIRIRPYRSLWGSCNREGVLRLNFYLNFVPTPCLEYVLVHELSHLIHMNHSKDFWRLVGSVLPDYKSRQTLLREYTSLLEPKGGNELL